MLHSRQSMAEVLNVLMVHQAPAFVDQLLNHWRAVTDPSHLLIAHGGLEADYRGVRHEAKVFVSDPRLRTYDHQREFQSITGVFHAVRDWLSACGRDFTFVYLSEYDHLPLIPDLNSRLIAQLASRQADVLAYNLARIDGTSYPHYLYHAAHPQFHPWLEKITVRSDPLVTLTMLGTGSFWSRSAFDAVAATDEPFPIYQEVFIPTVAHHLGFRISDYGEQNSFVSHTGERSAEILTVKERGAWTLHPVKRLPQVEQG